MKTLINAFELQFVMLHDRTLRFVSSLPEEMLFRRISHTDGNIGGLTVGENIIRSAGMVEMTFGGITRRLWDDPFEWTLPEALSSTQKIVEYLGEVEVLRISGFQFFTDDSDLSRSIPAPSELKTLGSILLETVARAEHFQGRAFAYLQVINDGKPSRR
ncbi:MAG: hypothetical protein IPJ55_13835 [Chloracidobacterium sp.]|nr:hypothetical protein [Chloracidobacterium sp.]